MSTPLTLPQHKGPKPHTPFKLRVLDGCARVLKSHMAKVGVNELLGAQAHDLSKTPPAAFLAMGTLHKCCPTSPLAMHVAWERNRGRQRWGGGPLRGGPLTQLLAQGGRVLQYDPQCSFKNFCFRPKSIPTHSGNAPMPKWCPRVLSIMTQTP